MPRIQKDTVSYFPHYADASAGDTLSVLQSRFGNDGYAFWFKLLEKLASTDGHYLDCRNSTKWQLLLVKMGVTELTGVEIMKSLVEMQAIDKELWDSKLIWCQKLVDNVAEVYKNRRREIPQKPVITGRYCITCGTNIEGLRSDAKYCSDKCRQEGHRVTDKRDTKNVEKGITTEVNAITTGDNPITTVVIPQSKVEYSKVHKESTERKEVSSSKNFELFWKSYPKHKSRGQAEKAFSKANPDEQLLATMLATIERAKKSADWQKEDGRYIPHPATWLNAKGWEDEFPMEGGSFGKYRGQPQENSTNGPGSVRRTIYRPDNK